MKTTRHRIYTLGFALALATSSLHATTSTLPAPKPEFLNSEQLAEWRAKKTAEFEAKQAQESAAASQAEHFYTGKPYFEETGQYAFLFRSYDPGLSRWTTSDPSGFPDGANNNLYSSRPLSEIDPTGLVLVSNSGNFKPTIAANDFVLAGGQAISSLTQPAGATGSHWDLFLGILNSAMTTWIPKIPIGNFQTQITATGDYDTTSNTWSNPGATAAAGQGASVGFTGSLGGTFTGTGTIGYSLAYSLSGSPSFTSTTSNPTNVVGSYVPMITISLSGSLNLAVGITVASNGSVNGTATKYSVQLKE